MNIFQIIPNILFVEDEKELNNLSLEEKQQFLKENEANIRECIGEAVPTIIMQKIIIFINKKLIMIKI